MRPTSIVVAGGGSETASIRAAGGVEFANATSLSLNGVFTSDYDDYMIVMNGEASTDDQYRLRLRASGSDATGSDYVRQFLSADSTSVTGSRATDSYFYSHLTGTAPNGYSWYFYGPQLAAPTAMRAISASSRSSARITDVAGTHSLSTAYDGLTIYPGTGSIDGLVTVYGLAQ